MKRAQKACGELLWIAQRSRPDISFVVSAMGSLLTRAVPWCLATVARLRSYLQRTKNLALSPRPTLLRAREATLGWWRYGLVLRCVGDQRGNLLLASQLPNASS